MKKDRNSRDRWLPVMRAAHLGREAAAEPDGWSGGVMRKIRALPAPKAALSPAVLLEDHFWKMVPAAVVLLVICLLAMARLGSVKDAEVLALLAYDTETVTLAQAVAD